MHISKWFELIVVSILMELMRPMRTVSETMEEHGAMAWSANAKWKTFGWARRRKLLQNSTKSYQMFRAVRSRFTVHASNSMKRNSISYRGARDENARQQERNWSWRRE